MNKCDICDLPMPGPMNEWPEYPFCSKRCRTIDLGRWLGESYRFSSEPVDQSTIDESHDSDT
ncbi:MAG: DNA gyrase inhibitor YacG [Zavarzinella sp.]